MKYIKYNGELNDGNVATLLSAINDIEGEITIYFGSQGGDCNEADVLLDVLDKNSDRLIIKPVWVIGSSAFNICYRTKCKVELLGDVWGMVHIASRITEFRDTLNPDDFDYHYAKWQKKEFKKDLKELFELPLTMDEKVCIEQGKIVNINPDRMRKIFKGRNK